MKWLRSIAAIGAGVTVGFVLYACLYALFMTLRWEDWTGDGSLVSVGTWLPGFARAAATAIAERLSGPPETWQVVAAFAGWHASVIVAGFVAAQLAPRRRLAHAIVVGALVVGGYDLAGTVYGPFAFGWGIIAYGMAEALLAGLGGLPVWWVARSRARATAQAQV